MRKVIPIVYRGIDSWNRPVFRSKNSYYGSVNKLFGFDTDKREVIEYFKNNIEDLEYFGNHFGCEPHGGFDHANYELRIVKRLTEES